MNQPPGCFRSRCCSEISIEKSWVQSRKDTNKHSFLGKKLGPIFHGIFTSFHGCLTFQNKNHPRSRTLLRLYLSCKSFHLRDRTSRRENPEFLFHSGIPHQKTPGILGVSQILRMIYKSETSEFQVFCKTSVSGFATTLAWLQLLLPMARCLGTSASGSFVAPADVDEQLPHSLWV